MMRRYILSLLLCILSIAGAGADTLHVTLTFPKKNSLADMKFYLMGDRNANDDDAKADDGEMTISGNTVSGDVTESAMGFYKLDCIVQGGQVETPLYAPAGTRELKLKMSFEDDIFPVATSNADCMALSRMAHSQGLLMRRLWTETMSEEQVKNLVADYQQTVREAEAVTASSKGQSSGTISPAVHQYLTVWAYSNAWLNLSNLPQMLRKDPKEVSVRPRGVLPLPATVLDCPVAACIPYNAFIITDDVRLQAKPDTTRLIKGSDPLIRRQRRLSLTEQLDYLYAHYQTESLRRMAQEMLVSRYISTFDYEHTYTDGLVELKRACDRYGLDQRYLLEFERHQSTISGATFPEEFPLVDRDGKSHSLGEFKGKYVYIDFWASWCRPCCAEIPHLQKLEKDLQNPDVVFLSISIDQKKDAWLQRMDELHCEGNQWLSIDPKLPDALNIESIPMFLIYNKEGKLLKYNAPRPSEEGLKELLEAL